MIKRMNDLLALLMLLVIMPGLWVLEGKGIIRLSGEITGATIAAFTLMVQYYFRKRPDGPAGGGRESP